MRPWGHIVYGVAALPLIHSYAHSDSPAERAVFVRIYLDMLAESLARAETAPPDWLADLQACLAGSEPAERDAYLAELARAQVVCPPAPLRKSRRLQDFSEDFSRATREDIDALLREGALGRWVALARDRAARLRPDHIAALVARARVLLAQSGDRRLAEAILSRDPVRLEAAPLFLEASGQQRWAILLAAQRADLGRRANAAPKLASEVAERLEFSAIAGESGEFAQALAAALDVELELAQRIAADPFGEPLAVALAALGAPRDLSVRVMTARDLREGDAFARIHTLARLSDRLSPSAARRIIQALGGPEAVAPVSPAAARVAENPSPFVRRESARRTASIPETTTRLARDSRRP